MATLTSDIGTSGEGSKMNGEKTPAQLLQEKHEAAEAHKVTIEDAIDEEDLVHPPPSMSASTATPADSGINTPTNGVLSEKAAGKQKAAEPVKKPSGLDTQSEEAFPSLGGPKSRPPPSWGAQPPTWGAKPQAQSTLSSRASTPSSGVLTPSSTNVPPSAQIYGARNGPQSLSMPGKHIDHIQLAPSQINKNKVLKQVLDDINRKSRARVTPRVGPNQSMIFEAAGSNQESVRQVLKQVSKELGVQQNLKIPVPVSVRPHIIGKGGSTIQNIMQQSGAKIQVPKSDDGPVPEEDDDSVTIDVEVTGDPIAASEAKKRIEDIISSRTSNVNMRLKDIPPEFFPFIAGPHNKNLSALEKDNLRIDVPQYHTWRHQPPPVVTKPNERPTFVPHPDMHIRLAGDRVAAQEARQEIERQVEQLRQQLILEEQNIQRAQHQFIIGERGIPLHDFLEQTGCSVVLPPDSDNTENITIIGPADQLEAGISRALELATEMNMSSIDPRRYLGNQAGSDAHLDALTQYLMEREITAELERLHNAHVVVPSSSEGPADWQIFAREGKNAAQARNDIIKILQAHPPTRISQVQADPFYQPHIQKQLEDSMLNDFGIRMIIPSDEDASHIFLVCEGAPQGDEPSQISRQRPSSPEALAFQQALKQAQAEIEKLMASESGDLSSKDLSVPRKYHEKVKRFVNQQAPAQQTSFPVNVKYGASKGAPPETISLRGPAPHVNTLGDQIAELLKELEEEEKERGYTTTFDFPQKFANQLIGKRGENINKLREEYDVDIQVDKSGKVEVKGPKIKAERCKTHIINFGKKLEDEVFYNIKVDPKFHRDLIGVKGASVRKLEERYGVHIQFPTSKNISDDQSVADTASEVGGPRRGRNQPLDEVWIRGPRKAADDARSEILDLAQYYKDQSYSATVSVAKKQLPSLMGKGGSEMSALRYETGAKIDVPSSQEVGDSERVDIKIRGTKAQVDKAKAMLQERAKAFDEIISRSIDVDKKYHQTLIGAHGSNIRRIVLDAGGPDNSARVVRFPDRTSDSTTIRIDGPKTLVDKVYEAISTFAQQKENQVTDEIDVPAEKHRMLIGRGGEIRRNIESQFNVSVDVPKQGSGRTGVKISGASTEVAKAKEHIADLVKDQAGETVAVPKALHHVVAQNGSFFRQLRNNHEVTVDHAGQKPPPKPKTNGRQGPSSNGFTPLITDDPSAAANAFSWELVDHTPVSNGEAEGTVPWVLSGPSPESVAKAKALIEKAVAEAGKPSATGYLILPDSKSYRLVVGPGGREINRIREKTGCKIQVPKAQGRAGGAGDTEEAIEIVGTKEGVEEAKDMILETVKKAGSS